ncbi:MAG TPA: thiamine phosphate synthase [Vicinamibacterales bacterium]
MTDRHRLARWSDDSPAALVALAGAAAAAGVNLIQIRENDLDSRTLCELVRSCVRAAAGSQARVVVNDRLDVALAGGADGVHLRSDSPAAVRVRQVVPARFLVGRSVHGAEEAEKAAAEGGLDYLIAGTIFPSGSKPGQTGFLGLDGLQAVVRRVTLPVLAIGGVTTETVADVAGTGVRGVAAIGMFCEAGVDIGRLASAVTSIRRSFDTENSLQ